MDFADIDLSTAAETKKTVLNIKAKFLDLILSYFWSINSFTVI